MTGTPDYSGHDLLEDNKISYGAAYGGPHLLTGGSGSGLTIGIPYNIVRYNEMYGNALFGARFGASISEESSYNYLYSNTFYHNGWGADDDPYALDAYRSGLYFYGNYCDHMHDNVVKNNLFHDHWTRYHTSYPVIGGPTYFEDVKACSVIENNCEECTDDPLFVNPDISDPMSATLPDLRLQSDSPMIDQGIYLTQANGSGSSSATLIVDDARYFQDGTWGSDLARSTLHADWIAIGTVDNVVQISSINYSTNMITLTSPTTWSDNASVWLYKKSDGTVVLRDSAPDMGAHEYVSGSDTTPPTFTISDGTSLIPVSSDTINITAEDETSLNENSLEYGFSSDNTCNASDTYGNSFTNSVDFTIFATHTDYLCVKAADTAGNIGYQLVGKLNVNCDICVNTTGWWRDNAAVNASSTPVQHAIDNATEGDTICVNDGTYTENVDVNKRLTIRSKNGSASTTVQAASTSDHVFNVTADYVNISGFNVTGATGSGKAGIYLSSGVNHCDISDNSASNCNRSIYLNYSSDNVLTGNNASNGNYGVYLTSSNNNQIYNNYFNNTNSARDDGTNIWNTTKTTGPNIIGGPYIGGNYWSDYPGVDTDGDGFGDVAYDIPGGSNKDHLPLVREICGDVDCDMTVDAADLQLLLERIFTGTPITRECAGDVDGNGCINILDARLLLNHIADRDAYPLNCTC